MRFKVRISGKINMNNETPLTKSWPHIIGNRQNKPLDGKVKTWQNLCPQAHAKETHGAVKILPGDILTRFFMHISACHLSDQFMLGRRINTYS